MKGGAYWYYRDGSGSLVMARAYEDIPKKFRKSAKQVSTQTTRSESSTAIEAKAKIKNLSSDLRHFRLNTSDFDLSSAMVGAGSGALLTLALLFRWNRRKRGHKIFGLSTLVLISLPALLTLAAPMLIPKIAPQASKGVFQSPAAIKEKVKEVEVQLESYIKNIEAISNDQAIPTP